MVWTRFRRDPLAVAGLVVLVLMAASALGAGLISEYVTHHKSYEQDLRAQLLPIGSPDYILGADDLGRDNLTRLLYGARVSLGVAGLAILGALLIGVTLGLLAGYFGGWVDSVLMRFVDVMLAVPGLFILLLVASMWRMGPLALSLVIAATSWITLSRLVRGEVLAARNREYVEAARVIGASDARLMTRHILPNVTPTIIIWASLAIPGLILAEAGLSFLGLGIQPPQPSWGNMLTNAQRVWTRSATQVMLPGLAIYITVFAINLVGNGLRDALDPRITD
jgi:peptide/nickel transport system permease protein